MRSRVLATKLVDISRYRLHLKTVLDEARQESPELQCTDAEANALIERVAQNFIDWLAKHPVMMLQSMVDNIEKDPNYLDAAVKETLENIGKEFTRVFGEDVAQPRPLKSEGSSR